MFGSRVLGARIEAHPNVSFSSSTGSNDLNSDRQTGASFFASAKRGIGTRALAVLTSVVIALLLTAVPSASGDQITFSPPDVGSSISVKSDHVVRWRVGHYEVLHLSGDIKIQQQQLTAAADQAILWVEAPTETGPDAVHKVIVYLEGQAVIELPRFGADNAHSATGIEKDRIVDEKRMGRLFTSATVDLNQVAFPLGDLPEPAIFGRAQQALNSGATSGVSQVQFTGQPGQAVVISPTTGLVEQVTPTVNHQPFSAFGAPTPATPQATFPPANSTAPLNNFAPNYQTTAPNLGPGSNPASRSPFNIQFSGRDSAVKLNLNSFRNPNNPNERVSVAVGGIRIVINSPEIAGAELFQGDKDRKLYILADNMVQWLSLIHI